VIDVIDGDGNNIMHFETHGETLASVGFVRALTDSPDMLMNTNPQATIHDTGVNWFGFDIRDMMQVIALDVMHYNFHTVGDKVQLPVGLWYYRNFTPAPYMDPYETLIPSTLRSDIDLGAACEFLGVVRPLDLMSNARAKAETARLLTLRAQLIDVPIDMR